MTQEFFIDSAIEHLRAEPVNGRDWSHGYRYWDSVCKEYVTVSVGDLMDLGARLCTMDDDAEDAWKRYLRGEGS